MVKLEIDKPSILIPYTGPDITEGIQDIFVYLRPETNGVAVESLLFQVIQENPLYQNHIKLVYLANIPGSFIVRYKIVEHHYAMRLLFAHCGADCFTPAMEENFADYFGVTSREASVFSAFQAMEELGYSEEDLFNLWVDAKDMHIINGEVIKRKDDHFIINAHLPAILRKNNNQTDIAAMIFRSDLRPAQIHRLIQEMGDRLKQRGVFDPKQPVSRAFHHSKGPFELVLDAMGYLYDSDCRHIPLKEISFCRYMMDQGFSPVDIVESLRHPILSYYNGSDDLVEEDIYTYTSGTDYAEALEKYRRIACLCILENKELGSQGGRISMEFWQDIL